MSEPSTEFLSIGELAEGLGCKTNRVRFLYRAGLFGLWSPQLVSYTEFVRSEHQELVEVIGGERHTVKFHRDLLGQPGLFLIALNTVNPAKFGPGWAGSTGLVGIPEPKRSQLVPPFGKVSVPRPSTRTSSVRSRPGDFSPHVRALRARRVTARATPTD